MAFALPDYAEQIGKNKGGHPKYLVDVDRAYPEMLAELGVEDVDQYWLEVAFQCIKMDMQLSCGMACEFIFRGSGADSKKKWALKNHPEGKGVHAATKGLEAREHYRKMRGFIPG